MFTKTILLLFLYFYIFCSTTDVEIIKEFIEMLNICTFFKAKRAFAKMMTCNSDKQLIDVMVCSLTNGRKNEMIVNFRARVVKQISPDTIYFDDSIKENGIFKPSRFANGTYNFCEAMEGNMSHFARMFIIKMLQIVAYQAIHKCPYTKVLSHL